MGEGTGAGGNGHSLHTRLPLCIPVHGKRMAAHSSTLGCRAPRTEEPGGLQSTGSQRARHTKPACSVLQNETISYRESQPAKEVSKGGLLQHMTVTWTITCHFFSNRRMSNGKTFSLDHVTFLILEHVFPKLAA